MENIVKGESLNIRTSLGVIKVIFSHYSDKWHKRFYTINGLEFNCNEVVK
jgi:hypothetical protein